MKNINRILLQLNKAVECANSDYIQERALAVIIFDNIVELFLYHYLKFHNFEIEERKYLNNIFKYKYTEKELNNFQNLLKYAKKHKIINKNQEKLFKLAHKIRNILYHKGNFYNEKNIDLALCLFYQIFNTEQLNLHDSFGFVSLLEEDFIDFGQEYIDKNTIPIKHEEYFDSSYKTIVNKWKLKFSFVELVHNIIFQKIEDIKSSIKFIEAEGEIYFKNKIKNYKRNTKKINLNKILLAELFEREYLLVPEVLSDDYIKKINFEFYSKYKDSYPYNVNFSKIEQKINKFKKNNDFDMILNSYIDIDAQLENIYIDTNNASFKLDGYIQLLFDEYKGK